jgi:hypothetical protein
MSRLIGISYLGAACIIGEVGHVRRIPNKARFAARSTSTASSLRRGICSVHAAVAADPSSRQLLQQRLAMKRRAPVWVSAANASGRLPDSVRTAT